MKTIGIYKDKYTHVCCVDYCYVTGQPNKIPILGFYITKKSFAKHNKKSGVKTDDAHKLIENPLSVSYALIKIFDDWITKNDITVLGFLRLVIV